jgi:tetratricopeptide (TPR) repeat protein
MNLAVLLSQTGRSAEAEVVVRGVLEHDPEHTQAAYSLGLLVAEAGRLEEAVPYLEIAANGRPMISRAAYNLGLVQQQLGRPDEAEAALRQAVEAEPDNLDYLYGLADHYVKRGELTRALTVAGRMISTNPQEAIGAELKAYIEQQMAAAGGSER